MAIFQGKGKRSPRGSRYKKYRNYKKHELGRVPSLTGLGRKRLQSIRILGGERKLRLLSEEFVNVSDAKNRKVKKVKIKNTIENPANRHFVRRNIMTKGTIIETEIGKARITSRPGQDGVVNAVLIS
ncbi:30S ribosomal protein S8e [Candidatus Woesearchaeota archaeon]|nr:30S ribosomal protein S8e [Candidatus Woesearchaeota archaeon]